MDKSCHLVGAIQYNKLQLDIVNLKQNFLRTVTAFCHVSKNNFGKEHAI